MLVKLRLKNRLTPPKKALDAMGAVLQFQVEMDGDRLVLPPARIGAAEVVRQKLEALDITDADIADAVAWSRKRRRG